MSAATFGGGAPISPARRNAALEASTASTSSGGSSIPRSSVGRSSAVNASRSASSASERSCLNIRPSLTAGSKWVTKRPGSGEKARPEQHHEQAAYHRDCHREGHGCRETPPTGHRQPGDDG